MQRTTRRPALVLPLTRGLIVVGLLAGCGYQLVDPRASLGPGEQAIAIQMFRNQTSEPGFERMLADAFQEEFRRRGGLEVRFGSGDGGDLVLGGVVQGVSVGTSAVSSIGLTLEDQVTVVVDVEITRGADRSLVLVHRGLSYDERFLSSPDPQVYESNKEEALRRLSSAIASRVNDELDQAY